AAALASAGYGCLLMVGGPDGQGRAGRVRIMRPDGSPLPEGRLREMAAHAERTPLPGHEGVGRLQGLCSVAEDYARAVVGRRGGSVDAPVILDCGRGSASACAPRILEAAGADLTTIDAHRGHRPPGPGGGGPARLAEIMGMELGSIGVALNGDGTRLALFDEDGRHVDPEGTLALMLLYLRPSSVVVPFDASALVDDAFMGLAGEGVRTGAAYGGGRRLIRAGNDLASVTEAVRGSGAELGAMADGTFIFPDLTLCPDAISAAVVLARMSGENNMGDLLASFPRYTALKESVRGIRNAESFGRRLGDRLRELGADGGMAVDGRRVCMEGGWFAISQAPGDPGRVDVKAEARDRAYAVSMMEMAKDIARGCM
ncbi:MAG: hypothetical protein FWH47_04300, partial [Methanomassiliicoccaceae archaeon]|nr:hypothetical protein [Methanomassiliicoccaceae archaeon]